MNSRGNLTAAFAVLMAAALLSSLTLALYETSASSSVQSSASSSGRSSSQSSSSIEINGKPVSNTSVRSSGSGQSGASVSESSIFGGSSDDLNAAVQQHFTQLNQIVATMQDFGVYPSLVADAQTHLMSEQQGWAQASSMDEKQLVLNQMNAFWADLRQRVKATGVAFDFDAQLVLNHVGGVTTANAGSSSSVIVSASAGSSRQKPTVSASPPPLPLATANVLANSLSQGSSQAQAVEHAGSNTMVDGFLRGVGSFMTQVGSAIEGFMRSIFG